MIKKPVKQPSAIFACYVQIRSSKNSQQVFTNYHKSIFRDEWSLLGAIGIHLTLTLNPNPNPNPIGSYTVYM